MASNLSLQIFEDYQEIEAPKAVSKALQPQQLTLPGNITKTVPIHAKKSYTKLNFSLFVTALSLLAINAALYFHSVQLETKANKLQQKIAQTEDHNYQLNVELAMTKELTSIEELASEKLQMKIANSNEINYISLPLVESKTVSGQPQHTFRPNPEILLGY